MKKKMIAIGLLGLGVGVILTGCHKKTDEVSTNTIQGTLKKVNEDNVEIVVTEVNGYDRFIKEGEYVIFNLDDDEMKKANKMKEGSYVEVEFDTPTEVILSMPLQIKSNTIKSTH